MREDISNYISNETTYQIHSIKACISLGRVSTKVVERIVKFHILDFYHILFFRFHYCLTIWG